jgi:hypothetical protein
METIGQSTTLKIKSPGAITLLAGGTIFLCPPRRAVPRTRVVRLEDGQRKIGDRTRVRVITVAYSTESDLNRLGYVNLSLLPELFRFLLHAGLDGVRF